MALASAILFGASTPFSKLLLGEVGPQLLAGLLYLGARASGWHLSTSGAWLLVCLHQKRRFVDRIFRGWQPWSYLAA